MYLSIILCSTACMNSRLYTHHKLRRFHWPVVLPVSYLHLILFPSIHLLLCMSGVADDLLQTHVMNITGINIV